ncbi:hypothetical protein BDW22DRAFT_1324624 [Trametopsis cervina]|nr:hypothetical protein BDW22DRAFT_1324624 [Trametopsis cervina]
MHNREAKVADVTTLRRHMDAMHRAKYKKWATNNDFESKLPTDVKARKDALDKLKEEQQTLDKHLHELPPKERVIRYTAAAFRQAAAQWLIATDQPLSALEHPRFKDMIELSSRATDGVEIPNRRAMRFEIMRTFHEQMITLKKTFSVCVLSNLYLEGVV